MQCFAYMHGNSSSSTKYSMEETRVLSQHVYMQNVFFISAILSVPVWLWLCTWYTNYLHACIMLLYAQSGTYVLLLSFTQVATHYLKLPWLFAS